MLVKVFMFLLYSSLYQTILVNLSMMPIGRG